MSDYLMPADSGTSLYYQTVTLHLFRPFLKVDLMNSEISPRAIVDSCAEKVSAILDTYRSLYTLRRTSVLVPHIVVSACTIYLVKLPSPSAGPSLAQLLNDLKEMSVNHPLTIRMLRIVLSLGKKWQLDLPLGLQRAVDSFSPEAVSPAFVGNQPFFQDPRNGPANVLPIRQLPFQQRDSATHAMISTSNISQGLAFNTSELFWPHFTDQGVPLQASHDNGHIEISAMLDGRFNDWEQSQRDGFKMASCNDPL